MHAFDYDLAPVVGQQATLASFNGVAASARIDLLIQRARTPFVSQELRGAVTECDLVAQVVEGGLKRGYPYDVPSAARAGGCLHLPAAGVRTTYGLQPLSN